MIKGGCLCGAVRYAVEGELGAAAVCHCRNCQRQTGSPFSVLTSVRRDALHLEGAPRMFEDRGESGAAVRRYFCSDCGSPIFSQVEASAEVVFLKAGTLDEPFGLAPRVHVWCDSAWTWPGIPEGTLRFARNTTSR